MGIQAAPEVKFTLIREATMHDNNLLKISKMCEIANVSRSGYYNWCASEEARKSRDDADRKDFDLILEAYKYRGYAKGARGIHMRLLHYPGIIMNVKKIRRLMRKFGLYCPIRKANPYRRMLNEMKTSSIAPNVVNREFKRGARKVLLTDISAAFTPRISGSIGLCLALETRPFRARLVCSSCSSDRGFARGLVSSPRPTSFRFRLTTDTLALS